MPNLVRRQPHDLPQLEETWHVFSFKLRTWVTEKHEKPVRPHGLMILDLASRLMMGVDMTETLSPEWVSEALLKAMTKPGQGIQPHRPRTITTPDSGLVAALAPRLAEIGVTCGQMATPEDMYETVAELESHLNRGQPSIAGLLSVEGVTPDLAGELFAAAAEFYQAAPWIKLTNSQALAVRLATEPQPHYVSVMGNAGIEYGLSVSMTWDDFRRLASGAVADPMDFIPDQGGHSFLFNAMTGIPFDDLDAIERYRWQILDESTVPFPMIFDRKGNISRPGRAELLWYQAALRAIPIFVRDYMRSEGAGDYAPAQASIAVPTSEGQVTVIVRYPAGELDIASEPAASMDWSEFGAEDAKANDVPVFDRRSMERHMAARAGQVGGSLFDDPQLRKAQEAMYKAWEEQNPAKRISLAHKALKLSPDCADAYVLLAEEEADTVGRALELYQQGVAAGERALGAHFEELAGKFWGVLETRPYMRARQGVADTLWRLGRREEARAHYEDMLRLNPGDNQGVRYLLAGLLLEMDRDADLRRLLNRYRSDGSAHWKYSLALVEFRQGGATDQADKALKRALRQNPHVPPYLIGQKRMPNNKPDYIGMGDENEAIAYAADHLNHWRRTEGAVDWLKAQLAAKATASSAKPKEPSFDDIVGDLVAEMTGPMPVSELVKQVLERKPSKAKNPVSAMMDKLRQNYGRASYVFLDRDTVMPIRLAMHGVRFRITLDRQMASACAVPLDPYFFPFLRSVRSYKPSIEFSFENEQGREIPTDVTTLRIQGAGLFGEVTHIDAQSVDLKEWLGPVRPRRGDCLLLTVLDWERGRLQIVLEPERRQRKKEIDAQNRALADMVYELLEATYDERLPVNIGIPTAYARLTSAHDYPGDHWLRVVERDERLKNRDFEIVHADSERGNLFEMFAQEPGEDAVKEKLFTAQQGRQVYRFHAARGKKEFIVELQGDDTLGDFDAVMKDAFKLDTWDHLSEFTAIMPRGKGKQPRLKHFGAMDPLGDYAAHHVRIAGLGLEQGTLIEYVYDFGDHIEHTLVLEYIGEPEQGVKYPRFHKVVSVKRKK